MTEKCTDCNGTGKKVYHGPFESSLGKCGFCDGHGTKEEQLKWYDKSFKGRGLGAPKKLAGKAARGLEGLL